MAPLQQQDGVAPSTGQAARARPSGHRTLSGPRPAPQRMASDASMRLDSMDAASTLPPPKKSSTKRPTFVSNWVSEPNSILDALLEEEDGFTVGPEQTPHLGTVSLPDIVTGHQGAISTSPTAMSSTTPSLSSRNQSMLQLQSALSPQNAQRTDTVEVLDPPVRTLTDHSQNSSPGSTTPPNFGEPLASPAFSSAPSSAKPRLRGLSIDTTHLVSPDDTAKQMSPGMKHWKQVRQHVMVPTPPEERATAGSIPGQPLRQQHTGGKKLNLVSIAAKRLGLRHAAENVMGYDRRRGSTFGAFGGTSGNLSEQEREEASRERRRFARNIKVCLDSCAAEESTRRLRRIAATSRVAELGIPVIPPPPGSKPKSVHHSTFHGETKSSKAQSSKALSVHNSTYQQSGKDGDEFSAYAPLLMELHRHLPDARAKRLWSRTCPHHAAILAELGTTFLPDATASGGERAQALEVFGTVVRNWATDSADEELDRWLWLCRALVVEDKQLRDRGLTLLRQVLHRDPSLPESGLYPNTASDLESLALGLVELLHAIEMASYPSLPQQEIVGSLIRELGHGDIIRVDHMSLMDLVDDSDVSTSSAGVERELLWITVAQILGSESHLAGWMLSNNSAVLRRFAPPPILHAAAPLVLRLRVLSATHFFASFASLVRNTRSSDVVSSVASVAEHIYNESAPLTSDDSVTAGYISVLLGVELWFNDGAPASADLFTATASPYRGRLLQLLDGAPKGVTAQVAQSFVNTYSLTRVVEAIRLFLGSNLSALGQQCVPYLFKRVKAADASNATLKPFLIWLATSHPKLFYKPLFACAAATQQSSLVEPLRTVHTLSELVGPGEFWTKADPQMVVITLVGDVAPRPAKGKGREGTQSTVAVKLGRYALLVELIVALRAVKEMGHARSQVKGFVTSLENRLGAMLEVEGKNGVHPNAYRSLVCQLFDLLRTMANWVKGTASTRLAACWYLGGTNQVPTSAASLDHAQVYSLQTIYAADDETKAARTAILDTAFVEALTTYIVTAQASLSTEDWGGMLPHIWERYAHPSQPIEQTTFMVMKCAEVVPGGLRNLVTSELFSGDPAKCIQALLKLALLYGYRYQVLNQHTVTNRRGATFKFSRHTLDFVTADMGSPEWVPPREVHDAALQKYGRSLPLELRQRLMELGWSEDDQMTASDFERVPVTAMPLPAPDADAGDPTRSTSPAHGAPLQRTSSAGSTQSTGVAKRRAVLPPVLLSLIAEQARVLLKADDVQVSTLSFEVVRMLEREEAAAFIRAPVAETLHGDMDNALARLNSAIAAPTPTFAYVAINTLVGFLKAKVRNDPHYPHWAVVLGTISRLIPFVSEMSLRDVRKTKAEHVLLPASIYEDQGGFKLHQPWRDDMIDVQTAQMTVLVNLLRANSRDVYLVKKMLFNLQVQATLTSLAFARAWLDLLVTLFSALNSNYNDRAELRHFLSNISQVLDLHGSADMIVTAQAMRVLSLCSARFRRVFASIGFVDVMRTVYKTYVYGHSAIKDCIEYACRSFYRIHQDVFVYQLCLAIAEERRVEEFDSAAAYKLIACLSSDSNPLAGVPSGIRGLNDKQEIEALVQMVSGGAEVSLTEIGHRNAERQAQRAATLSLEPVVFPQENIVRLLVTVIAVNAASARAIKFLGLFASLVPHITSEKSKALMAEGVDAIGRFIYKERIGDDAAMLRFLPGDENTPPNWIAAKREYVRLVDAFSRTGGEVSVTATRRLLDVVISLLNTETESVGPVASSILGALTRTHLASKHPGDFLRDLASTFRQFLTSVNFSGVLESIADFIRRSQYNLTPHMTALIVNSYLDPSIRMVALASEENMAFLFPMRKATVDLLAACIFLREADSLSVLEDVVCTPGMLAGVVLPLSLLIEAPQDVDREEAYNGFWVRLLQILLHPKTARSVNTTPALAAVAVLSLQIVKVVAVRAPEAIARVNGLWRYVATALLTMVGDGDGRWYDSVSNGAPRVVDWMMWSLFELVVVHRSPLSIDARLRIQTVLAAMSSGADDRSRPSSIASSGSRRLFDHPTPSRSLSGLVRRPTMRMASAGPSPLGAIPSGSPSSSPTPAHQRQLSSVANPATPLRSSTNPATPRQVTLLRSVSTRVPSSSTQGASPGSVRPSFAALSARRASRPNFDAFGGGRNNRFPSSSPVRNLHHGDKGGAIVHLLGPATTALTAPSTGVAVPKANTGYDPRRAAVRDLHLKSSELADGARRAVNTVMSVYGYEVDEEAESHVWSVPDALHAITEQTRIFVEDEFRIVFSPPQNAALASLDTSGLHGDQTKTDSYDDDEKFSTTEDSHILKYSRDVHFTDEPESMSIRTRTSFEPEPQPAHVGYNLNSYSIHQDASGSLGVPALSVESADSHRGHLHVPTLSISHA